MFASTLSLIHKISKVLPLIQNFVRNELGNVREGGEEGAVVVLRPPTSSSLKQSTQLTVSDRVRGISPISVGLNPRITNGTL